MTVVGGELADDDSNGKDPHSLGPGRTRKGTKLGRQYAVLRTSRRAVIPLGLGEELVVIRMISGSIFARM